MSDLTSEQQQLTTMQNASGQLNSLGSLLMNTIGPLINSEINNTLTGLQSSNVYNDQVTQLNSYILSNVTQNFTPFTTYNASVLNPSVQGSYSSQLTGIQNNYDNLINGVGEFPNGSCTNFYDCTNNYGGVNYAVNGINNLYNYVPISSSFSQEGTQVPVMNAYINYIGGDNNVVISGPTPLTFDSNTQNYNGSSLFVINSGNQITNETIYTLVCIIDFSFYYTGPTHGCSGYLGGYILVNGTTMYGNNVVTPTCNADNLYISSSSTIVMKPEDYFQIMGNQCSSNGAIASNQSVTITVIGTQ